MLQVVKTGGSLPGPQVVSFPMASKQPLRGIFEGVSYGSLSVPRLTKVVKEAWLSDEYYFDTEVPSRDYVISPDGERHAAHRAPDVS